MASSPVPGWYSDPADPTTHRYWDGNQWTKKTRPGGDVTTLDFAMPDSATLIAADGHHATRTRRRVGIVAAIVLGVGALLALGFALAGGGSGSGGPAAGAPAPGPGSVQFTSDSGAITINVPDEWQESTSEARDMFDGFAPPTMTVQGAWDLDGGLFMGGSSMVVSTYGGVVGDSEALAEQSFAALEAMFGGASAAVLEDVETHEGVELKRMDLDHDIPNIDMYQIELVAVVDGQGVEIAISLMDASSADRDAALAAVQSLTFG